MKLQFLWMRFLPDSLINNLATLGALGHVKKAPGTVGSFAGLIYYTAIFHSMSFLSYAFFLAATIYASILICNEAEARLNQRDPSCIILDEFIAMPICFIGLKPAMMMYPMWIFMLSGFLLFRFFDILKPFGISKLQNLQGGVGVVVDDLAAACICLHGGLYFYEEKLYSIFT